MLWDDIIMNCPVCSSDNTEIVYSDKNSCITNIKFSLPLTICICNQCSFVYNAVSHKDEYSKAITNAYTEFKKNDFFSFPNKSAENMRTLNMILKHLPEKKDINILEIGSNRGDMLFMIKEKIPNANILGIDPTKYNELSVPTIHAFYDCDMFSKAYDLVILQHVLEHMENPLTTIQSTKNILKDNGLLYVEVPDIMNCLQYCVEDFTLEHVNYFSIQTLSNALQGFDIIDSDQYSFLRTTSKPVKQKHKHNFSDINRIKKLFKIYNENKSNLINEIKKSSYRGERIIFYGISYYFISIFTRIKEFLNKEKCFYYDDNFCEPNEHSFHLPRVNSLNKGDLIIVCSANFRIQEKIEQKLYKYKGIKILRPWFSYTTVK